MSEFLIAVLIIIAAIVVLGIIGFAGFLVVTRIMFKIFKNMSDDMFDKRNSRK